MKTSKHAAGYLCGIIGLLGTGSVYATTVKQGSDGQIIAPETIDTAIRHGALLVTLEKGESLNALGFSATAIEPSQIHLSASSEFLTLAVLKGKTRMNGKTAGAGDALVTGFAGSKTLRTAFDARRLAGTASAGIADEVNLSLVPVIKRHRTFAFFGVFEPTGINAASPGNPLAENIRRDILLDPAVMAVRSGAGSDRAATKTAVTTAFVTAIDSQDSTTTAGLLDPMPFLSAGRDWTSVRQAFAATNIVAWKAQGVMEIKGFDGDTADIEVGGHKARLILIEREGSYFVSSLEILP